MLEQKVFPIVQQLREIAKQRDVILLDDSINSDIGNINQPLSQAWLLKSYVEGLYPYDDVYKVIAESYIDPKGRRGGSKTRKVLREIKPDKIGGQLRLGLDNYSMMC